MGRGMKREERGREGGGQEKRVGGGEGGGQEKRAEGEGNGRGGGRAETRLDVLDTDVLECLCEPLAVTRLKQIVDLLVKQLCALVINVRIRPIRAIRLGIELSRPNQAREVRASRHTNTPR